MTDYQTIIFDCDGVILDSNKAKSQAFYQAALPYGEEAAKTFFDYHVRNGGISRYEKFKYFLETIVPQHSDFMNGFTLPELLQTFANLVRDALMSCEIAAGIQQLRDTMPNATWCVVSGGDQEELNAVFKARHISCLFNGGVFGSPDNKYEIMTRELANNNIKFPAIFFGDSQLDYEVAKAFEVDFTFLSKWTEFEGWKQYCSENNIKARESIACLLTDFNSTFGVVGKVAETEIYRE